MPACSTEWENEQAVVLKDDIKDARSKHKTELKIIEGLGKLYPAFETDYGTTLHYTEFSRDIPWRTWWIYQLCRYHLKQRIPSLEDYIKENCEYDWLQYVMHFNIDSIDFY